MEYNWTRCAPEGAHSSAGSRPRRFQRSRMRPALLCAFLAAGSLGFSAVNQDAQPQETTKPLPQSDPKQDPKKSAPDKNLAPNSISPLLPNAPATPAASDSAKPPVTDGGVPPVDPAKL